MDDTEFWKTEQHFETLEVHAHRFLLLAVWMSRILRGILCLSMNDSQALFIGLRHWPQSWRRAKSSRLASIAESSCKGAQSSIRASEATGRPEVWWYTRCNAFSRKPHANIICIQWVAKLPFPASTTWISLPFPEPGHWHFPGKNCPPAQPRGGPTIST